MAALAVSHKIGFIEAAILVACEGFLWVKVSVREF